MIAEPLSDFSGYGGHTPRANRARPAACPEAVFAESDHNRNDTHERVVGSASPFATDDGHGALVIHRIDASSVAQSFAESDQLTCDTHTLYVGLGTNLATDDGRCGCVTQKATASSVAQFPAAVGRRQRANQKKLATAATVSPDAVGQLACANHSDLAAASDLFTSEAGHAEVGCHVDTAGPEVQSCDAEGVATVDSRSSEQAPPLRIALSPSIEPTIVQIIERYRIRRDLQSAALRLELQIQSVCRRFCAGDKDAAGKVWGNIRKERPCEIGKRVLHSHEVLFICLDLLQQQLDATTKALTKLAKGLPVWVEWGEAQRGFGALSLAQIIGECNADPGVYRSPAAVWKRMGLAVINGSAQGYQRSEAGRMSRVTGDAAIEHGYSPVRRSVAYVIGECLMKAKGPYRELYLERKEFERAKVGEEAAAIIPHRRAMRYVTKRLLRDLWRACRHQGGIDA